MACSATGDDKFWKARGHKKKDIPHYKNMALSVLVNLRADGMSSDECQTPAGVVMYARRTHKWWSAMLQVLLNDIRQWLKKNGCITLNYSKSEVFSKHPAPTGLPKFCYHDELAT